MQIHIDTNRELYTHTNTHTHKNKDANIDTNTEDLASSPHRYISLGNNQCLKQRCKYTLIQIEK